MRPSLTSFIGCTLDGTVLASNSPFGRVAPIMRKMGKTDMAETELERAEKRYAQAKARLQGLKNREATKARKIDTRRKIILGGALMDLAGRDDGAAKMLDRLVRNLPREQDRKAFETGPTDGSDASGGSSTAPPAPANGRADVMPPQTSGSVVPSGAHAPDAG